MYVPNTTHIDLYNTGDEALLKPHDRPQDLRSRGRTRSITRQKIHAPGRRLVTVLEVQERRAVVLSSFSSNLLGINLPLPPPSPPLLIQGWRHSNSVRACVHWRARVGKRSSSKPPSPHQWVTARVRWHSVLPSLTCTRYHALRTISFHTAPVP